jgi:pyridoxamine 5'-phosphate oxidase
MDPIAQFRQWFDEALASDMIEPRAMVLATASADGLPSARVVLLKDLDERGLVFFTNYESRKGRELRDNPRAALVLYWPPHERQVRIEGRVTKTSREESEAYFRTRPLGSRHGAWISPQSRVIESRDELDRKLEELLASGGEDVALPEHWGGYRVAPESIELWEGRPNRLHDRFLHTRQSDGTWRSVRLAP